MKIILLLILFQLLFFNTLYTSDIMGTLIPLKGTPIIVGVPEVKVIEETNIIEKKQILCRKNTSAKFIYNDGANFVIESGSLVSIHRKFVKLKKGQTHFYLHKLNGQFKIFTPTVMVGIYGTELIINVDKNGFSTIKLLDGKIKVSALKGNIKSIFLESGQMINADEKGITSDVMTIPELKKNEKSEPEIEESFIPTHSEKNIETYGKGIIQIRLIRDKVNNDSSSGLQINHADLDYRILINDCGSLNQRIMKYPFKTSAILKNLEFRSYDVTVIMNGIYYSFPVNLSHKKPIFSKDIFCDIVNVEISLGKLAKQNLLNEIKKNIKIYISHSEIWFPLCFTDYNKNPKYEGYSVSIYQGVQPTFFYPRNIGKLPDITIKYIGEIPCRKKSFVIPLKFEQPKIQVDFTR